jgi:predicted RNA-binding protein with TRAM domain
VKVLFSSDEDSYSREAPVKAGEEYDVEIEDIAKKGDGIARVEGFVIFVSGTKVGDKIKIHIDSVKRKVAEAHKV